MTTFQDVAAFIGQASKTEVDTLFDLCRNRHRLIGQVESLANMAALKPGDKVMITAGIRPKYLIGVMGTVALQSSSRAGSVSVTLDNPVGKFSNISPIGVPASCLTKVDA